MLEPMILPFPVWWDIQTFNVWYVYLHVVVLVKVNVLQKESFPGPLRLLAMGPVAFLSKTPRLDIHGSNQSHLPSFNPNMHRFIDCADDTRGVEATPSQWGVPLGKG